MYVLRDGVLYYFNKKKELKHGDHVMTDPEISRYVKRIHTRIMKYRSSFYTYLIHRSKKYAGKFLHFSQKEFGVRDIVDMTKREGTWLAGYSTSSYEYTYQNPFGIWFSCGNDWLKFAHKTAPSFIRPLLYEIIVDFDRVLYINTVHELRKFMRKYLDKEPPFVNWKRVKRDYDGLIICPYLGHKIWNKISFKYNIPTSLPLKYIQSILGNKIYSIDGFMMEWYRHWETGSGVVWNPRSIKSVELLEIHKQFYRWWKKYFVPFNNIIEAERSNITTTKE